MRQNRVWMNHVSLWTRALDYAPNFWSIHYNLGMGYLEKKQYTEAYREFNQAAALDQQPSIYNELALTQIGLGDKDGAMRSLQMALALDPRLVEAKTNMGALLYDKGNYREAAKQFAEVLQIDPRVTEAHFNLARASAALGDHETAVREYKILLTKRPDDTEAQAGLAESYEVLKRQQEAGSTQLRVAETVQK
jgi:tetratricopeptide (TPR) repeat protein